MVCARVPATLTAGGTPGKSKWRQGSASQRIVCHEPRFASHDYALQAMFGQFDVWEQAGCTLESTKWAGNQMQGDVPRRKSTMHACVPTKYVAMFATFASL